jgi:hypothetical protein
LDWLEGKTNWRIKKTFFYHCIKVFIYALYVLFIPKAVYAAVFNVPSGNVPALVESIKIANTTAEDDTIFLEAGTYTLTGVDNTTDGANGLPSIISNIEIIGDGPGVTIIERDSTAEPFRIFHIADTGTLILEGLAITGGFVECCYIGGGIFNDGSLVVTNSVISGNSAEFEGGGLAGNGTATIINSTVSNNSAQDGGGIFGSSVDITSSIISDNFAQGFGGGIDGTVNIKDSQILNNQAGFLGGGIFGTVTMKDSLVAGNSSDFRGGGIANIGTSNITNTTISGNGAEFSGGAISNSDSLTLSNSSIYDNFSGFGAVVDNTESLLVLLNSTIADNNGGGIENVDAITTIINSTISNNEFGVDNFNGSEFFGVVEIQNTIIALNNFGDCFGPITSLGNNLVGDSSGCDLSTGPDDRFGNPGLGDFTDDGTPGNGHYPLLADSQAINAGNHDVCSDIPILAADQIGQKRVGVCDIGAIESIINITDINGIVKFESLPKTIQQIKKKKACPGTYPWRFRFRAKLTNISDNMLSDIVVRLKENSPKDAKITITVLNKAGYKDALLEPGESAQVRFEVCFKQKFNSIGLDLLKAALGLSHLADLVDVKGSVTEPNEDENTL